MPFFASPGLTEPFAVVFANRTEYRDTLISSSDTSSTEILRVVVRSA